MMIKYFSLFLLLTLFVTTANAQSADQTSIPTSQEEKLLEATIICLDAAEAPTEYNEFVIQFITTTSFPKKEIAASEDEYKTKIKDWLISNPMIIDKIISERKKAHDKLYGSRPY